ncbi:hypothetical protein [Pseudacidovorax intermedius]|uniref:hypothetical protein n=1 Tax=Pseudacidovorax intermedius TaxID=433924 RepID=UPI00128F496D|nr:hypothetical protein [Pseudacidovorax intermedius]
MRLLIAALAAAALAGCAASGVRVTDDQVAHFQRGVTTKAEVLQALGKPTMQMRMGDGTSMVIYSFAEVAVRPATFIPVVGAFAGGADSRSNTMTLRFDAAERLVDTTSSATETGTGRGASAGPVAPVSDQPRR